jgi:hypothetical protein
MDRPPATLDLIFSVMRAVFLVFVAEEFENVGVGEEAVGELNGERPSVHLGIVKSHLDIEVAEVAPVVALRDVQSFAVRVAHDIEPGLVIEAAGLDYQRVTLPLSDRVAEPSRFGVLRKRPAVSVDAAVAVGRFEQHGD